MRPWDGTGLRLKIGSSWGQMASICAARLRTIDSSAISFACGEHGFMGPEVNLASLLRRGRDPLLLACLPQLDDGLPGPLPIDVRLQDRVAVVDDLQDQREHRDHQRGLERGPLHGRRRVPIRPPRQGNVCRGDIPPRLLWRQVSTRSYSVMAEASPHRALRQTSARVRRWSCVGAGILDGTGFLSIVLETRNAIMLFSRSPMSDRVRTNPMERLRPLVESEAASRNILPRRLAGLGWRCVLHAGAGTARRAPARPPGPSAAARVSSGAAKMCRRAP